MPNKKWEQSCRIVPIFLQKVMKILHLRCEHTGRKSLPLVYQNSFRYSHKTNAHNTIIDAHRTHRYALVYGVIRYIA